MGIDASLLPHVFERFRQGDASTTRRHGGLSLGLAIVKNLAELYGGSVRAKSGGLAAGAISTVPWSKASPDEATDSPGALSTPSIHTLTKAATEAMSSAGSTGFERCI